MAAIAIPVYQQLELGDRREQDNPQDILKLLQVVFAVQEVLIAFFNKMGNCHRHGNNYR